MPIQIFSKVFSHQALSGQDGQVNSGQVIVATLSEANKLKGDLRSIFHAELDFPFCTNGCCLVRWEIEHFCMAQPALSL